jgi:hypothetical protein
VLYRFLVFGFLDSPDVCLNPGSVIHTLKLLQRREKCVLGAIEEESDLPITTLPLAKARSALRTDAAVNNTLAPFFSLLAIFTGLWE